MSAGHEATRKRRNVVSLSSVFTAEESRKLTEMLCDWIDEEGEDLGWIFLDNDGRPIDGEGEA